MHVYGYINNNLKIYGLFEGMVEFILGILFYSKSKENLNFIPNLISKGLIDVIIRIFSIILIFLDSKCFNISDFRTVFYFY